MKPTVVASIICLAVIDGCAVNQMQSRVYDIPSFKTAAGLLMPEEALASVPDKDPLAMTPAMERYVEKNIMVFRKGRQRLWALNQSLRGGGLRALEYNPEKTLTAQEAFEQGQANCLAYSNLFIAMARYAGMEAKYQEVQLRPNWTERNGWITVGRHVNVTGTVRGSNYVADFDPNQARETLSSHPVSDREARSQYFNNLAIDFLTADDIESAYRYAVKSISLSRSAYLWVNLGAILKANGQYEVAEKAYFVALAKDPRNQQAMTNLSVLFHEQGQEVRAREFANKVRKYRRKNPYFHAELAHRAEQKDDFEGAESHLLKAIKRGKKNANLYFHLARMQNAQGQREKSLANLDKALEHTKSSEDRNIYLRFKAEMFGL